jgi:hypothetical protein
VFEVRAFGLVTVAPEFCSVRGKDAIGLRLGNGDAAGLNLTSAIISDYVSIRSRTLTP